MRCTEELKEEGEVHAHNEEEVAKESGLVIICQCSREIQILWDFEHIYIH